MTEFIQFLHAEAQTGAEVAAERPGERLGQAVPLRSSAQRSDSTPPASGPDQGSQTMKAA